MSALERITQGSHLTYYSFMFFIAYAFKGGAQWLSGRALDSRPRGRGFESHRRHWVVSLSKNINPSLVLVQPRKSGPYITERLLMGCKDLNQTKRFLRTSACVCRMSENCKSLDLQGKCNI